MYAMCWENAVARDCKAKYLRHAMLRIAHSARTRLASFPGRTCHTTSPSYTSCDCVSPAPEDTYHGEARPCSNNSRPGASGGGKKGAEAIAASGARTSCWDRRNCRLVGLHTFCLETTLAPPPSLCFYFFPFLPSPRSFHRLM